MNIVMMMVSSVNGKITREKESNIYEWTSAEDSDLFFSAIERHNLIVMGRSTFEAARSKIKLRPDKRRIVFTHDPDRYSKDVVPGSLEFTSESPEQLVHRMEHAGYTNMLLAGGAEINAAFLHAGLVNELHLTIEPFLFGTGKNLIRDIPGTIFLTLLESRKLNDKGTLHLRYRVDK